jgi:hypothetical protein
VASNIIDIIIRATNKTRQALREPINDLTDLKGALVGASALWAAAGTAALAAGTVIAKQAMDAAARADDMAQKLGLSAEAITTLDFAATQSGTSVERFQAGMEKMAMIASQAAMGNKAAADSFKAVGVDVTDAHGRMLPMDQVLLRVADRFQVMPDNAAKAQMAFQLFGKAGVELIPMLNKGSAGIEQLQARARELGLEISGSTAAAAAQFNDNMDQLKDSSAGLGRTFIAEVLPGLNTLVDGFLKGQGLGTAWNSILKALGVTLVAIFKVLMSIVVEVDRAIEKLGARLARTMATVAALAVDGWRGAVNAWKAGNEEIDRINSAAKDRHKAIWTGVTPGPPPPDPVKNKIGFEEVLKQNEEAKVALDTQRQAELDAIQSLDRATVESRLFALNQKRFLNQKEAEDYRALQATLRQLDNQDTKKAELAAKKQAEQRQQVMDQMWSSLISLSQSKNSTLVAIGKTAAIAQATIDTWGGANKAMNSGIPFPLNLAAAAAIVTAGLANVAQIAGVPGFAAGGVVPGTDLTGDRRLIRVNSQEEVMTTQDRRDTTAALLGALQALRGGGGGGGGRAVLQLDKRTLGEVIFQGTMDGTIQIHPRALRA